MLRTSTRNLAYEVISCLIDEKGNGVLTDIIRFLTSVNKNYVLETGCSSFLDGTQRKRQTYGKHHMLSQGSCNETEGEPLKNLYVGHRLDSEGDDTESCLPGEKKLR